MSGGDSLRARIAREENDRQAALSGAVRAFPKLKDASASSMTSRQPASGASAAATKIWQANSNPNPPRPPAKPLSLSAASYGAVRAHQRSQENILLQQDAVLSPRAGSPSSAAAVYATSQHKPQPSQSPSAKSLKPQPQLRRLPLRYDDKHEEDTDSLPEPGTVKDVKKWLQALEHTSGEEPPPSEKAGSRRPSENSNAQSLDQPTRLTSNQIRRMSINSQAQPSSRSPPILSPRPIRAISAASSIEAASRRDAAAKVINTARQRGASGSIREDPSDLPSIRSRPAISTRRSVSLKPKSAAGEDDEAERPPLPTRKPTLTSSRSTSYSESKNIPLTKAQSQVPAAPPPRRSRLHPTTTYDNHTANQDPSPRPSIAPRASTDTSITPLETTPSLPPRPSIDTTTTSVSSRSPAPALLQPQKNRSTTDLPTRPQPLPLRRVSPAISSTNLANAIVASSLASSRAPSPTKSPTPSLPPRPLATPHSAKRHTHFWSKDETRTPSPAKGMRHTMRRHSTSSSESSPQRKPHRKFLVRKHPHKHSEGDRRRWRDEVTSVERKRYEGVWAANRGLLLPPSNEQDVHGYVVRDVWSRSRLPRHVLEEVWDLVDSRKRGRLSREEFVVGLWLVDQRLKGRKLPTRVGESVWQSVKTGGVVVKGVGGKG